MKGKIGIMIALALMLMTPVAIAYGTGMGGVPITDPGEQYMQNAENAHMFGTFTYDAVTGEVSGRFVEFRMSDDGTISDYTVKHSDSSIKVFDEVYLEAFTPRGTPRVEGAMFQYTGAEAMIMAHNNPSAVLHFTTMNSGDTVVYVLADGFTATALPESYNVKIQGNGVTAYLINGNSNISIENNTVTVGFESASESVFRLTPVEGPVGQTNQNKVTEKIQEGKIIAEVSVSVYNGEHGVDAVTYGRDVQTQVQNAEINRVEIKVSAESQEGKCVVINVDKETMSLSTDHEIVVKLDGSRMEKTDVDTVLNSNDAKGRYSVAEGSDAYQIYVYIPHFSDHTLTVETETSGSNTEASTPGFTALFLVMGLVIATGMVYLQRR